MKLKILLFALLLLVTISSCHREQQIRHDRIRYQFPEIKNAPDNLSTPILRIDSGGHMERIQFIKFSNNGKKIISASYDKTIRIWDIDTGITEITMRGEIKKGRHGMIYTAALSPNNQLLAVSGYPTSYGIRVIDLIKRKIVLTLKQHSNVVLGLDFSKDNKRLISGSADGTAIIWDLSNAHIIHRLGSPGATIIGNSNNKVNAVAFSQCGRYVATANEDGAVVLWNTLTGETISNHKKHNKAVVSLAFTPDGNYLLSGGRDNTIRLWKIRKGVFSSFFSMMKINNEKPGAYIKTLANQSCSVEHLSISSDSTMVLTGQGQCQQVGKNNIFSIPGGKKIISCQRHHGIVLATDFSPIANIAATAGGEDNEILLWDIRTGEILKKLAGKGKSLWAVGFHKDGRSIAWGTSWKSNNIFQHGSLEQAFQIFKGNDFDNNEIPSLSLGPDLRSLENYVDEVHLKKDYVQGIKQVGNISIATINDELSELMLIQRNGKMIHKIKRHHRLPYLHRSATLTHDGNLAFSGGMAGQLSSYNIYTGKKEKDYDGHTGTVTGLAVSPDSSILASVSSDQTIRLWDIQTGKNLLSIFCANDREWVAWTPKGYYWSSLKGDSYIGWHINMGIENNALYCQANRFADKFRNKNVVVEYIKSGGNLKTALRITNLNRHAKERIKQTNINEINNYLPPSLKFVDPDEYEINIKDRKYCVSATAESRTKDHVTDIWLSLNGRQTKGYETQKKLFGQTAEITQCFEFTEPKNRISLFAKTKHNQSEAETIIVNSKYRFIESDLYLVSIGVTKYQKAEYDLVVAHNDAIKIENIFKSQKGVHYNNVHTKLLINEDATKINIIDALEWLKNEATQKDTCVLFIAGHGLNDNNNNYYFLPHEFNGIPYRTGVASDLFTDVMRILPSKVLFWIDTCHSGSITRDWKKDISSSIRDLTANQRGVVLMMASTGHEESISKAEWGHGAFTKAIVDGLFDFQADLDLDKKINITELDNYVTRRVKNLTYGKQHPTTEIPISIVGDFVIMKPFK